MIKDDGSVIHFNNPKVRNTKEIINRKCCTIFSNCQVQASLAANTFAVTGHAENKRKIKLISIKVCLEFEFYN